MSEDCSLDLPADLSLEPKKIKFDSVNDDAYQSTHYTKNQLSGSVRGIFFSSNETYALLIAQTDYLVLKVEAKQMEIVERFDLPGYMQIDENSRDDYWLGAISNDGKRIILHRYRDANVTLKRQTKEDDKTKSGFKSTRVKHWLNLVWIRVGSTVR